MRKISKCIGRRLWGFSYLDQRLFLVILGLTQHPPCFQSLQMRLSIVRHHCVAFRPKSYSADTLLTRDYRVDAKGRMELVFLAGCYLGDSPPHNIPRGRLHSIPVRQIIKGQIAVQTPCWFQVQKRQSALQFWAGRKGKARAAGFWIKPRTDSLADVGPQKLSLLSLS